MYELFRKIWIWILFCGQFPVTFRFTRYCTVPLVYLELYQVGQESLNFGFHLGSCYSPQHKTIRKHIESPANTVVAQLWDYEYHATIWGLRCSSIAGWKHCAVNSSTSALRRSLRSHRFGRVLIESISQGASRVGGGAKRESPTKIYRLQ